MSSRFNTLYQGDAIDAAELLENFDGVSADEIDADELRVALVNALRRIGALERKVLRVRTTHAAAPMRAATEFSEQFDPDDPTGMIQPP